MAQQTDISSFTLTLDQLRFVGTDLHRAECVLATEAGNLFVSDSRGGVTWLRADGSETLIARKSDGPNPGLLANGIALQRDGSFLLADIGGEGGVWRLARDGELTPVLLEAEGLALKVCNFVGIDEQERTWIAISTRQNPRSLAYRSGLDDGYVVLLDAKGARIVADGLGFTNEVRPDPTGQWLYVNETFSQRLTRFRLRPDGSLGARETVVAFDDGTFPDGLTFDAEGGVWITGPISNRIVRVDADGRPHVVLEDFDPDYLATVVEALHTGTLGRAQMDNPRSRLLTGIASLAFGGPDLRTAYVGNLLGRRLFVFDAPVAGAPPPHWGYR
ncbi:MAG TPA: SMP-30/gluconolactonase/LRE family protein [bacterium]|nr:SMP-30/gluconolactonase/LRE family protein [bacterium]